ncbi:Hypothetical predicted protein [Cloeon dipterum]|uniref:Uncharacterized protein n=1 Tax=Cloeon dipterum TaxID=197152 RepID=A0A8S1E2L5_9INSE|nr:Hypothetical predicted protein [Cloeon dipterum]
MAKFSFKFIEWGFSSDILLYKTPPPRSRRRTLMRGDFKRNSREEECKLMLLRKTKNIIAHNLVEEINRSLRKMKRHPARVIQLPAVTRRKSRIRRIWI